MAITRITVEKKIAAIEDKGENTAFEVRDVLTELLNYTENQPNVTNLIPFQISGTAEEAGDKLLYSFRGLENQTVNFTFKIMFNGKSKGPYKFPIDPNIFTKLKNIVPIPSIENFGYTVVVNNYNNDIVNRLQLVRPSIWAMNLKFTSNEVVFNFFNIFEKNLFKSDDEICTSIHFHCPKF